MKGWDWAARDKLEEERQKGKAGNKRETEQKKRRGKGQKRVRGGVGGGRRSEEGVGLAETRVIIRV